MTDTAICSAVNTCVDTQHSQRSNIDSPGRTHRYLALGTYDALVYIRSGEDLLQPGSGNGGVHLHNVATGVFADKVVEEEPVA